MRVEVLYSSLFVSAYASALASQEVFSLESNVGDARRPNVVFILTDDQDVHLGSLDFMPFVKKHILDQGTYFSKHYCTTAVCCPSRVTLWTGKAAHNTNITDVNPPYGGYPKFVAEGFNEKYLPLWLQQAGYNTYYTGKLFNVHTVDNYDSPVPAGFTDSDFLLDPYTYDYTNSTFQRKGEGPRSYEGQYVTDVLAENTFRLLDEAIQAIDQNPFFLTIAPSAPHGHIKMTGSVLDGTAAFERDTPIPAPRHAHLFADEIVPRTKNFNPNEPSGASWLLELPLQRPDNLDYNDHYHRQRLRSLQAVDELVDTLFARLEEANLLDNTYVVYSSDNGFHIGQHRLQPGKSCGYEEDINIPLIIRGPGVERGAQTDIVTSHTDLAPTFFELLGIPLRDEFDGKAIPVQSTKIGDEMRTGREHVSIEYWGYAGGEGTFDDTLHENNTYKAIRVHSPTYNLYYSIWCTNEHELYDMNVDPGQLTNLLSAANTLNTSFRYLPSSSSTTSSSIRKATSITALVSRLDALLLVTKSCSGITCRQPWLSLHPTGDVQTLEDALDSRFDHFYEAETPRVRYEWCWNGYWREAEGVMWEDVAKGFGYGIGEKGVYDGAVWPDWV